MTIRTFTGQYINVLAPRPDDIDPRDIAHHLAMECRWAGATRRHYSVAEHCIWVGRFIQELVPAPHVKMAQVYALLHDAHEAYLKDIPTPLKKMWPGYGKLCDLMDEAIYRRFHLVPPSFEMVEAIKTADGFAAWCEKETLIAPNRMADKKHTCIEPPKLVKDLVGMHWAIATPPENVEKTYLSTLNFLLTQVM